MPQLSRCFQTERNRSSQRVKTSVLVRYSRHWSFVMETAPSLVLSFTLCSIPPLFHFHCPLLILYPLACPSAFTFMNLNSSVQKLYMLCSFLRYSESLRIWFPKASNMEATDALTDCDFQWNASISWDSLLHPFTPPSALLTRNVLVEKKTWKKSLYSDTELHQGDSSTQYLQSRKHLATATSWTLAAFAKPPAPSKSPQRMAQYSPCQLHCMSTTKHTWPASPGFGQMGRLSVVAQTVCSGFWLSKT